MEHRFPVLTLQKSISKHKHLVIFSFRLFYLIFLWAHVLLLRSSWKGFIVSSITSVNQGDESLDMMGGGKKAKAEFVKTMSGTWEGQAIKGRWHAKLTHFPPHGSRGKQKQTHTLHHLGQVHNSMEMGGSAFLVVATKDTRFTHKGSG